MMFENDLKYCPECKEEYRQEISVCATCRVDLLSGTQMLEKLGNPEQNSQAKVEIQAGDELVSIQNGNLLDMKRVRNLFAKHNIPALLIKDEHRRSGCCGGVEVALQIRWVDRDRAANILQEEHERTTGLQIDQDRADEESIFNPDAQLAVCPACGHSFSPNGPDCPDCGLCFI